MTPDQNTPQAKYKKCNRRKMLMFANFFVAMVLFSVIQPYLSPPMPQEVLESLKFVGVLIAGTTFTTFLLFFLLGLSDEGNSPRNDHE